LYLFGIEFIGGLIFAGGLVGIFQGLHRRLSRGAGKTVEESVKRFYCDVLLERDYGRAYCILAPVATQQSGYNSSSKLLEAWEGVGRQIEKAAITYGQEKVVCGGCEEESSGFWTHLMYQPPSSTPFFCKCPRCGSIYCQGCFGELGQERICTGCQLP